LKTINKISYILNNNQKKSLFYLAFLIFIGMLFEVAGLGMVIPAIKIFNDPDFLNKNTTLKIFHDLFKKTEKQKLVIYGMFFLSSFYLLKAFFLTFLNWEQSKFSSNFTAYISHKLYKEYIYMNYENHLLTNSAILIRNIQNEVGIFTSLTQSIIFLSTEISIIVGVIILLFSIEPIGAFITILFLIVAILLFSLLSRRKISKLGLERQLYSGEINQNLMQGLGGIKDIKLIGAEKYFLQEFEDKNNKVARITSIVNTLDQLPRLYLEFIAIAGLSVLIIVMVLNNKPIDHIIPVLGIFVGAAFRMIPSVNKIMYSSQRVVFSLPVINLIYDEFKNFKAKRDENLVESSIIFNNSIKLINLNFSYNQNKKSTLTNINIEIKKGQSIGIVGESGSGKSTLIDIILGLLENYKGEILVDDVKLTLNNKRIWQKKIGYVPQSIYLIDDSLLKNIAFGVDDDKIDFTLVNKVIKDAQLDSFINSLPDGIYTKVGERGVRLSGGQRQRIGIARALYRCPEIVVLDEATSALDHYTEQEVMKSIDCLKSFKTLIIVAHRLTTVMNCDIIYKFQNGNIVESGTPSKMFQK